MTHASVHIQIAPEAAPTPPCWFGEVAILAEILKTYGLVKLIETKVRFARARFDHYELCYSRHKLAVAARNCRFWEFSQRVSGQLLCSIGILRKDLLHARFQGKFKCLLAILEFDQLVIMANWVKGWIVRTQLPGRKSLSGRPSARGQDVSRWRVPTLDPGPRPQRRLAVLPRLCATAGALRT